MYFVYKILSIPRLHLTSSRHLSEWNLNLACFVVIFSSYLIFTYIECDECPIIRFSPKAGDVTFNTIWLYVDNRLWEAKQKSTSDKKVERLRYLKRAFLSRTWHRINVAYEHCLSLYKQWWPDGPIIPTEQWYSDIGILKYCPYNICFH